MLILASSSPRRQQLLQDAGVQFEIRSADVDETPMNGELVQDYTMRLAGTKARTVAEPGETVLGADTAVVIAGKILGKPTTRQEAVAMLNLLSGKTHHVTTAVYVLYENKTRSFIETTLVRFRNINEKEILAYIDSDKPLDKAGAYGIQAGASKFVEHIEGCYFNVVGLPIARVYTLLRSLPCSEKYMSY